MAVLLRHMEHPTSNPAGDPDGQRRRYGRVREEFETFKPGRIVNEMVTENGVVFCNTKI